MIPKEDQEAETLSHRLTLAGYKFTHIGNESGQRGTANIIKMMAKKKRLGVSKGFPDYCIILKRGSLLFLELKREKKSLSKVSKEQQDWVDELGKIKNVQAEICYGSYNSIQKIEELENL